MSASKETYQAYLIRFWRKDETTAWRMMLQQVQPEAKYHFADLEEMVAFLESELGFDEISTLLPEA